MRLYIKAAHLLIILAVIGVNLFFGLPRLTKYSAVDETLWSYGRVPKFWHSIEKHNWKGTSLCGKPGVTLAIISGTCLPFSPDPKILESLRYKPKTPEQLLDIEKMYFFLRLPVYLFTLASLFAFYFLLRRLLGDMIAIFSVIFMGLSPILLGISLIINTDAILWVLIPLSLLSFLIYQKEDNKKFLYLAGFILGMGILTKFVANLLFPFFLLLIYLKYILEGHTEISYQVAYFKKSLRDYLTLIATSLLTIFIFYPSAWIKPKELLNTTIYSMALEKTWPLFIASIMIIFADVFLFRSILSRKICAIFSSRKRLVVKIISAAILLLIIFVIMNVFAGMRIYDFEQILSMPKPDIIFSEEFKQNFLSAFFPLIFGLTPLTALLFIMAIAFLIGTKKEVGVGISRLIYAFYLLVFIIVYYLANSFASISSTVRYQIVNYPLASIIAAAGLYEIINLKNIKERLTKVNFYALVSLLVAVSAISLFQIKPFFLSYAPSLLPNKYILNLKDMGDGSWEASEYLNSLPNAAKLTVWSDKKQVCERFIGKCHTGFNFNDKENFHFDYFIASTGGKSETFGRSKLVGEKYLLKIGNQTIDATELYYKDRAQDYKLVIDKRPKNYIKVVASELITQ